MAHLYVIPGHGAGDPGAIGNGYQEAERVRALATKIKQYGGDNVTLADFNRNYYADNGISNLNISKDWQILELHMDSAGAGAKGGHVIIQSSFNADKYDTALAKFISGYFPGRSVTISKRSDLANPNRAAAKGYPYRLVEVCFITDASDVKKFNANLDAIAKGILEAFDIKPAGSSAPVSTVKLVGTHLHTPNNTNAQKWIVEWDKENKWFKLKSKSCGLYLDVKDGGTKTPEKGTPVRVCTGNNSPAQWWRFEEFVDKDYTKSEFAPVMFMPKCNEDLVLDCKDGNEKSGAGIQLWIMNDTEAQKWVIVDHGNNEWGIINTKGTMALDVDNGGN